MTRRPNRRGAFTLVELLVVISIASLLAAITLGGYRSIGEGQTRLSCQTNLTQIYAALRLYGNDNDGLFPAYAPTNSAGNKGIGLWALYVLPSSTDADKTSDVGDTLTGGAPKPIASYLRNHKQLHCPSDTDNEDRFLSGTGDQFNMSYLSYQAQDGSEWTYKPSRTTVQTDPLFKRQLIRYQGASTTPLIRTPDDTTVVTWCKWHRLTREIDNVLFFDGSVRPIPKEQPDPSGGPTIFTDWKRLPRN